MDWLVGMESIAEVGIGLAGFSGIVVAFLHRKGNMTTLDRIRLGILLSAAFGAVFLALLPFGLVAVNLEGPMLWVTASAVHATVSALQLAGLAILTRRFFRTHRHIFNLAVLIPVFTLYVLNTVLQVINLAGVVWQPSLGPYYLGLLWLIFHAGLQFSRILFVRVEDSSSSAEVGS
jgi:hypothetical protein